MPYDQSIHIHPPKCDVQYPWLRNYTLVALMGCNETCKFGGSDCVKTCCTLYILAFVLSMFEHLLYFYKTQNSSETLRNGMTLTELPVASFTFRQEIYVHKQTYLFIIISILNQNFSQIAAFVFSSWSSISETRWNTYRSSSFRKVVCDICDSFINCLFYSKGLFTGNIATNYFRNGKSAIISFENQKSKIKGNGKLYNLINWSTSKIQWL